MKEERERERERDGGEGKRLLLQFKKKNEIIRF